MQIELRKTSALEPHPLNVKLYGNGAVDPDLLASIKAIGITQPLEVTGDGIIISGHRRWYVARALKMETVPAIRCPTNDELEQEQRLIHTNKQRQKDNTTLAREAQQLSRIEEALAKARQGTRTDIVTKSSQCLDAGKAREKVAAHLGVGVQKAARLVQVAKTIDDLRDRGQQEAAVEIEKQLNQSVNAGYRASLKHEGTVPKAVDKPKKPAPKQPSLIVTEPIPEYITLDQWHALPQKDREAALHAEPKGTFNAQSSERDEHRKMLGDPDYIESSGNIEWAKHSHNPVTGCKHNCPYCYARDIAERFYPYKFAPALIPHKIHLPRTRTPPDRAATDIGYKNVFTCSMADLFGKWVPKEWIDAVIASCAAAPAWNFLLLTKFPSRLVEFDFPDNCWVGTTVDCQARVEAAEKAFANVRAKFKWLSCEPLIEPLKFKRLNVFDWIVIGGASRSSQTPEYVPPAAWLGELFVQAVSHGLGIYLKTNGRPREYPGRAPTSAPEAMRYLPSASA